MPSMMQAFQRLFGGREAKRGDGHALLPPDERLGHIAQNIHAMNAAVAADQPITLNREVGSRHSKAEIVSNRIHQDTSEPVDSQLGLLDDALSDYSRLEEEIRCQLARKITRLLPRLSHSRQQMVLDHTIQVLHMLARDQSERVREMVAEELSDLPEAPYDVVQQLAWDHKLSVACPILEFSPLLRDEDLLDIIGTSGIPGVVEAIARRRSVSEPVGEAIAETRLPAAIHHLLENDGARLSSRALDCIVEQAPQHTFWHDMLVRRPELNRSTVNRIAGFVSQNLISQLESQGHLRPRHKQDTTIAVNHRLKSWTADQERTAELRARDMHALGRLDEETIGNAIAEVNEPFVAAALGILAQMPTDTAKRILRSRSGSAITALAWRAGLSMRTAMALQMKIGKVHHTKMLNARGGTDYPISEFEMQTYLEIFTG